MMSLVLLILVSAIALNKLVSPSQCNSHSNSRVYQLDQLLLLHMPRALPRGAATCIPLTGRGVREKSSSRPERVLLARKRIPR
jgi:hypothetical protein